MDRIVFAAFADKRDADRAIDDLISSGISKDKISVITKQGWENARETRQPEQMVKGAGVGATEGVMIGGLAGLLAGTLGIIVLGPIALLIGASGIIGTTISGIVIGLVAGALVGALVNLGVPKETAEQYENVVMSDGVILAVPIMVRGEKTVRAVLSRNHAEDLTELDIPDKR